MFVQLEIWQGLLERLIVCENVKKIVIENLILVAL